MTGYNQYYIKFMILVIPAIFTLAAAGKSIDDYVKALELSGRDPIAFTLAKLDSFDLLIFDDALHDAADPFDFYQKLIADPEFIRKAGYIFIEVFSIDKQQYLDAYLQSVPEDSTVLAPVFQNDYSGEGWNMQTYLDLMRTVYRINRDLAPESQLKVIAVCNPFYWACIHSAEDLENARKSLAGRDYFMYTIIKRKLEDFEHGRKGIFLTNTRHAYKGIRNGKGELYWNTGTFFHQWHPGKTYSIRFHNVSLYITSSVPDDSITQRTTAGMERMRYTWARMDEGRWDRAFRAYGNRPVAMPLTGTPFGRAPYIGNHMLDAAAGQTMADAYDAVIFLAPIEELHQTAKFDFIYTPDFRQDLERRYRILYTPEQISAMLAKANVRSLQELFTTELIRQPRRIHPLSGAVPPLE
jgi:hypothetical protein